MLLAGLLNPSVALAASQPPPENETIDPTLQQAFQARVNDTGAKVLGFLINDVHIVDVQYSADGTLALLWLGMFDPQTGEAVPGEPGLAIARLTETEVGAQAWMVTLQADSDWQNVLDQVPDDLLPQEVRVPYITSGEKVNENGTQQTFSGYKLPWAASLTGTLTQSISHDSTSCTSGLCHYAFDFARVGGVPNWSILAAKGGTVKMFKMDVPTRDLSLCPPDGTTGNYIVLEDKSTTPTTYQLYLHMAANSIPTRLQTIGAVVNQGDFLGTVDNTGPSCGSHLHFQVQSSGSSYLTSSVDITFDDVSVDGGRPRTCAENPSSCSSTYVSGNIGTNPPTGTLSQPAAGTVVTSSTLTVAGSGADDQQVTNMQVIARGTDGIWRDVGPAQTANPFSELINLCGASVPSGPVDIALQVWDNHGNVTVLPQGLRTILNNYTCSPPPACTLTSTKIILYTEANYQGTCSEFAQSGFEVTIPNLDLAGSSVGSNQVASVQVGSSTRVVLFEGNNYSGRNETLETSDPNLADNLIGVDTVSSIKVQPTSMNSGDLGSPQLVEPLANSSVLSTQSLLPRIQDSSSHSYAVPGGATYQIEISTVDSNGAIISPIISLDNLKVPWASIGSLPASLNDQRYRIRIWAKNNAGRANGTGPVYFTVAQDNSLSSQPAKSAPYQADFSSDTGDWVHDGLWTFVGNGWRYGNQDGSSYAGSGANSGSLTSPPIAIPGSGSAYLRFGYNYHTETTGALWDQRHVQISVGGGVFQDLPVLGQLYDDPQDYDLTSPPIDLSAYQGKTVRIRFYFNTLDSSWNTGSGWLINSFNVTSDYSAQSCAETTPDNSMTTATSIGVGNTLSGKTICPAGDIDYYKFTGLAGEHITAAVSAKDIGSQMDPVLTLLDKNGSLIVENDDRVRYTEQDPLLGAVLPYTGTYYLKVKAWDYPGSGGPDYFYTLRLMDDNTHPSVSISGANQGWVANQPFKVDVTASDDQGVARVDFYWHSSDWVSGTWQYLAEDSDPSDGWGITVDPSGLSGLTGGGLYVQASDFAGNTWGDMRLNLAVDGIKPASQLNTLPSTTASTAVHLTWSASDAQSGLDHIDIQYQLDNGSWQTWSSQSGGANGAWFLGQAGHKYGFRIRAVDKAGNAEDYPASAEASTTLASSCSAGANEPANNDQGGAVAMTAGKPLSGVFCPAADVDWARVTLEGGKTYTVALYSIGGGAAGRVQIYDSTNTLVADKTATGVGNAVTISLTPSAATSYTLKVTPLSGLYGSGVTYTLIAFVPKYLYLPVVGR